MTYVVIALLGNFQSEVFLERPGFIVAVDVQKDAAWFGMLLLDKADSGVEERASQMTTLEAGQHIDLLQLVDIDA